MKARKNSCSCAAGKGRPPLQGVDWILISPFSTQELEEGEEEGRGHSSPRKTSFFTSLSMDFFTIRLTSSFSRIRAIFRPKSLASSQTPSLNDRDEKKKGWCIFSSSSTQHRLRNRF